MALYHSPPINGLYERYLRSYQWERLQMLDPSQLSASTHLIGKLASDGSSVKINLLLFRVTMRVDKTMYTANLHTCPD